MELLKKDLQSTDRTSSNANSMRQLLDFLVELNARKIFYRLSCDNDEALMVEIAVPGERWEIEFYAEGEVEVEIFDHSSGVKGGEKAKAALNELFARFSE